MVYQDSDKITYKGTNILSIRKDIDNNDIKLYVNSFYRIIEAQALYKNISTLPVQQIKNLKAANARPSVSTNKDLPAITKTTIPFNYTNIKEQVSFKLTHAGKNLACLILSETIAPERLPFDYMEAKIFFKSNFKDDIKSVFERYCKHNNIKPSELLQYYENKKQRLPDSKKTTKPKTTDSLLKAFLQITK